MNKTVILAVPFLYGLDQCIEKNLRHHGYNVINLCYDDRDTYYPTLKSRLLSAYHKHITQNSDYKKKLRFDVYQNDIQAKLAALGSNKADYALCIRANIYPKEIIEKIRFHSKVCINYQWDGIDRFPDILDYLPYFDRCFVFDKSDVEKYPEHRFQTASNFYFDFPLNITETVSNKLYFLGGYEQKREKETKLFIDFARSNHLPLDFHIYCKDDRAKNLFGSDGINYLNRETVLSFTDNLKKSATCGVIVDFVSPDHNGCSFRIFDALNYNKKLITTNPTVTEYDFYHPDNIFVWDTRNSDEIKSFLNRPYQEIDYRIKEKYGFKHWLDRLLHHETQNQTEKQP